MKSAHLSGFGALLTVILATSPVAAQNVRRIPVTTGATGSVRVVHIDSTLWMVDGSLVYRRSVSDAPTRPWDALPQLYRCRSASIVGGSRTQIRVVAQRAMPRDTSWWLFGSSVIDSAGDGTWADSIRLDASGFFLGPVVMQNPQKSHLLFTPSQPGEPLAITVWSGEDGSFQATHYAQEMLSPQAISVGRCGDSLVVIQLRPGSTYVVDVLRGVRSAPSSWTVHSIDTVEFAKITGNVFDSLGCALVSQRQGRLIIDREGQTWNIPHGRADVTRGVFDGFRSVVAEGRGVTVWPDVRSATKRAIRAAPPITSSPLMLCLAGTYAFMSNRVRQILQMRIDDTTASPSGDAELITQGLQSRGTRVMLSGGRALLAGLSGDDREVQSSDMELVCALGPSVKGRFLDTVQTVARAIRHQFIENVRGSVWLGTDDGIINVDDGAKITRRAVAGVSANERMILLHTSRGVARYDEANREVRDIIDDYSILGVVATGDTIVTFRVETAASSVPGEVEARLVVDSYDVDGVPYFLGVTVADFVIERSLRFYSATSTAEGIIVNGGPEQFLSTNGGATWSQLNLGMRLVTPVAKYNGHLYAWGHASDSTQGIWKFDRATAVFQQMELVTATPVLNVAVMPGWVVFSTQDGVWSAASELVSVQDDENRSDQEFETESSGEGLEFYDMLGRRMPDVSTAPNGWYVAARRTSNGVRSSIHFQQR